MGEESTVLPVLPVVVEGALSAGGAPWQAGQYDKDILSFP